MLETALTWLVWFLVADAAIGILAAVVIVLVALIMGKKITK